jgi:hypothetical protein
LIIILFYRIQEGYIQCDPKQSAHETTQVKKADAFHSIIKLLVQLGADVATRDHVIKKILSQNYLKIIFDKSFKSFVNRQEILFFILVQP